MIHITEQKVPSKLIEPRSRVEAGVQPAHHKTKGSTPGAEDSDTDHEAPVAQQMLSFVMDDPDFESEGSDTPQIIKVSLNWNWEFFLLCSSKFTHLNKGSLVLFKKKKSTLS